MSEIMELLNTAILNMIPNYLGTLDWTYITTFTLLGYIFLRLPIRDWVQKRWSFKLRTRYWMAIIGFAHASIRAAALSMGGPELLTLFQSFVFAMIFYQLLLDSVVKWLERQLLQNPLGWFKWFGELGKDKQNKED